MYGTNYENVYLMDRKKNMCLFTEVKKNVRRFDSKCARAFARIRLGQLNDWEKRMQ